jgi:hypothetical protein
MTENLTYSLCLRYAQPAGHLQRIATIPFAIRGRCAQGHERAGRAVASEQLPGQRRWLDRQPFDTGQPAF